MQTTFSLTQLLVLVGYFLAVYVYKNFTTLDLFSQKARDFLRGMIPAFNLICGLALGYFNIAGLDITTAVLGTLATGGGASLLSMPAKLIKTTVKNESTTTEPDKDQRI